MTDKRAAAPVKEEKGEGEQDDVSFLRTVSTKEGVV